MAEGYSRSQQMGEYSENSPRRAVGHGRYHNRQLAANNAQQVVAPVNRFQAWRDQESSDDEAVHHRGEPTNHGRESGRPQQRSHRRQHGGQQHSRAQSAPPYGVGHPARVSHRSHRRQQSAANEALENPSPGRERNHGAYSSRSRRPGRCPFTRDTPLFVVHQRHGFVRGPRSRSPSPITEEDDIYRDDLLYIHHYLTQLPVLLRRRYVNNPLPPPRPSPPVDIDQSRRFVLVPDPVEDLTIIPAQVLNNIRIFTSIAHNRMDDFDAQRELSIHHETAGRRVAQASGDSPRDELDEGDRDENDYEALLDLEERIGYVNLGLTMDEIDSKLPALQVDEASFETANCCICLSNIQLGEYERQLPCSHRMHKECLDQWLQNDARCPVCRRDMRQEGN